MAKVFYRFDVFRVLPACTNQNLIINFTWVSQNCIASYYFSLHTGGVRSLTHQRECMNIQEQGESFIDQCTHSSAWQLL